MRKGILIGFLVMFGVFVIIGNVGAEPWMGPGDYTGSWTHASGQKSSEELTKEKVWGDLFDRVSVRVKSGEIRVSSKDRAVNFTKDIGKLSLSKGALQCFSGGPPFFIKAEIEIVRLRHNLIKTRRIDIYPDDLLYLKVLALYYLGLEALKVTLNEIDQAFR